jgi:DNA-binding response OmpR family regulator
LALIIEDSEDQNVVFTKALGLAGYDTESILDGITAQTVLMEIVPEIIILDVHIPGQAIPFAPDLRRQASRKCACDIGYSRCCTGYHLANAGRSHFIEPISLHN